MKHAALIAIIISCACFKICAAEISEPNTIYDSDSNHLWNRLNQILFVRTSADGKTYGLDELDILYWRSTKNLLTSPSHGLAIGALDEFIHSHGENLIHDPLKRAFLQHDLWELFDWSAAVYGSPENVRAARELQTRLATIIHQVALTTNEIAALPDNYLQSEKAQVPDLPTGFSQTDGEWLSVGHPNAGEVAPIHLPDFNGHSIFSVMVRFPGGRSDALDYLEKLRQFPEHEHLWVYQINRFKFSSTNEPDEVLQLNKNLPQFDTNTEWILVRKMCLIAADGSMQPSPITESIQMRRYLRTDVPVPVSGFKTNNVQQFFEFHLDRRQNGMLRAIGRDEPGLPFVHFRTMGIDSFEHSSRNPFTERKLLNQCFTCHSARGIFSVLSYTGLGRSSPSSHFFTLAPVKVTNEVSATMSWKYRQYDWGLLQGLWLQIQ